jgi:hypothetical protein
MLSLSRIGSRFYAHEACTSSVFFCVGFIWHLRTVTTAFKAVLAHSKLIISSHITSISIVRKKVLNTD